MDAIEKRLESATPGPWGYYGGENADHPTRGTLEAAPGLTIGSTCNTEPIARLSGYLLPVEANADFVIHAPEDIKWLLARVKESDALLRELSEAVKTYRLLSGNENPLSQTYDAWIRMRTANIAVDDYFAKTQDADSS